jgi:hypothetical protein
LRGGVGVVIAPEDAARELAAAIEETDLSRAHAAIRAGADPNAPIAFRHKELTRRQTLLLKPIVVATIKDNDNMVAMLVANGVRSDDPENLQALCVADAMHQHRALPVLQQWLPPERRPACPEFRSGRPILLQLELKRSTVP